MYLQESNLAAFPSQSIHCLLDRASDGTHGDDDICSFRIAVVVEQFVITSCDLIDLVEIFFYDVRQIIIILIICFSDLEVDIAVLYGVSQCWVFRVQRSVFEICQCFFVHQTCDLIHIRNLDFVDFMGCSESIKEVHERDIGFDSCQVCYRCQVCDLLNG